jgi:hypothetical protein
LQADRSTYSATNPFPASGGYTLLLTVAGDGGASPGGDGYGKAQVTASGFVSFAGTLADNTSVAPGAVSVSKYGQWPLYIAPYGKLGAVLGWIDFTNGAFAGEAGWFRAGANGPLYKSGFTNWLSVVSSPFVPGTAKSPILDVTNLTVTLSGGGLPSALSNSVTLRDNGKLVPEGAGTSNLGLSVNLASGEITGAFVDPATRRLSVIKGVVLEQQTNAGGFFVATNATGKFELTPAP